MDKLNSICKNKWVRYLATYSIAFFVCYIVCYQVYFTLYNKAPIWTYDAIDNNYPMFIYVGRWWRELIKNFTVRHTFEIPMWDMSIGFGADIITSLGNGFNNFYNPFYIISALFPADKSETAFKLVLILQMFFSGVSFSAMAYHKKKDFNAVLIGALCYVFSSNTIIVFKQASFGYVFVILPLIILGLWLIREGRKPYLLIFSITSIIAYSYYFAYMAAIIMIVYYVIEVAFSIFEKKGKNLKDELFTFLRVAGSVIIAAAIGFFMILPSVIAISKLTRLDVDYYIPLFQDKYYYCRLTYGAVSVFDGWTDDMLGFPVLALICIFGLFVLTGLKEMLKEKLLFVIATLALIFPFVGHVLNGFSYATNRWAWAYTLLISFIVMLVIDKIRDAAKWKLLILIGLLIGYRFFLKTVFDYVAPKCDTPVYFGIIILVLFIILPKPSLENFLRECAVIMILCLSISPFYYWTESNSNTQSQLIENKTAFNSIIQSGGKETLNLVSKDEVFRYDTLASRLKNSSMIIGSCGYDEYNSIYNTHLDNLLADLGITSSVSSSIINGITTRSDLETLFGTRYIIRDNADQGTPLPYGYSVHVADFVSGNGSIYDLYTSSHDTGMVMFFDETMNESDYDKLDCYNKQQALMNTVVLEDEDSSNSFSNVESIPYTMQPGEAVTVNGNDITVSSDGGYIDFCLDGLYEGTGECYLQLTNLINNDSDKRNFSVSAFGMRGDETVAFWSAVGPSTSRHHMYGGKDSWLLKSNFTYQSVDKVRLTFNQAGSYSFDGFSVYLEKESDIASNVENLKHPDSGLSQKGNEMNTTVDLAKDGYVLITVPYSEGWTAKVDGKDTEILRADRAFMALKLTKGQHEIELSYRTPYLAIGLSGAAVIIVSLVAVEFYRNRKQKKYI